MSDINKEGEQEVKEQQLPDKTMENVTDHKPMAMDETKDLDKTDENNTIQQQEQQIKKKYGGMLLKKTPLISKDHERAYFDSADWALGKGAKPKGPLEALRPKLQPTPHSRARRSAYAPADEGEVEGSDHNNCSSEDQTGESNEANGDNPVAEEQKSHV
ncbi:hypothetical protein ACFE04_024789 [Oxalis oulophora]